MFGNGFGFDPSQAGFNGMNWTGSGGFNPMMMNGMSNGNWNNFGMMGKLLQSRSHIGSSTDVKTQACPAWGWTQWPCPKECSEASEVKAWA